MISISSNEESPKKSTTENDQTISSQIADTEQQTVLQGSSETGIIADEVKANSSPPKVIQSPDGKRPGGTNSDVPFESPTREIIVDGLLSYDDHPSIDATLDQQLLFVVHGIGANPVHLRAQLDRIRKTVNNVRNIKKNEFKAPVIIKIIDWKSMLPWEVKEKIERVTQKTNKKQRTLFNEVPVDALFYLTSNHASLILNQVATQMNYFYDRLSNKYPRIKVSIIAHSLGSVILYDLLTYKFRDVNYLKSKQEISPLSFAIESIFFFGSPLGLFLTITESELLQLDKVPNEEKNKICREFFNIFHPNDLIAYRLEPLLKDYPDLTPEEIPYIKNDGYKKFVERKVKARIEDLKELSKLNPNSTFIRYDFLLQEGYLENMFETIGILQGHWGYWDSADLFYFVLRKLQPEEPHLRIFPPKMQIFNSPKNK